MTKKDIFIQILSEVSGKPKSEVEKLFVMFNKANPSDAWDKSVPDDEAKKLIADLRNEAPGILAWLHAGANRVTDRGSKSTK